MTKSQRASEAIRQNIDSIRALCQGYGVEDLRVFGSVARGQDGPDSDVDLLVKLKDSTSLIDLGLLSRDLSRLLNRPVDLITHGGLDQATLTYFLDRTTGLDMAVLVPPEDLNKHMKNIEGLLWAIERIERACEGIGQADFMASDVLKDAAMRNLQTMGQISRGVTLEAIDDSSRQTLLALMTLETMLYKTTDDGLLWRMVSEDISLLKKKLEAIQLGVKSYNAPGYCL